MPFCPLYMNPAILKSACFLWICIYIPSGTRFYIFFNPSSRVEKKLNLELCERLDHGTFK